MLWSKNNSVMDARKRRMEFARQEETLPMHHFVDSMTNEEDDIEHPHNKQVMDLVVWRVGVFDDRWYIKPRSTCWFDEFIFQRYTLEQLYFIMCMRRCTFHLLCEDLSPYIQGQSSRWRNPICVEKKVVVTMYKLIHDTTILLVADKAATGRSIELWPRTCRPSWKWERGENATLSNADFERRKLEVTITRLSYL